MGIMNKKIDKIKNTKKTRLSRSVLEDNSDRKLEHKKTTKHKYYKKLHRYVLFEKEKDKKKQKNT